MGLIGLESYWRSAPYSTPLSLISCLQFIYINHLQFLLAMDEKSVTAVDYLEEQLELEREAREVMPYEPDVCTYPKSCRQLVFACLTCRRQNEGANIGVCYLCLIQCHSTHELVELFSKRDFTCDCGTSRMHKGSSCALRAKQARELVAAESTTNTSVQMSPARGSPVKPPRLRTGSFSESFAFSSIDLPPADDIASLDNNYNHNYEGKFCSCEMIYNPIQETRTMHQCYLGDVCGEDWFHQDCILGYKPGIHRKPIQSSGENMLDELPPPGLEASEDKPLVTPLVDEDDDDVIPHFPEIDSFGEFVCWKCVEANRAAFDELKQYLKIVVHHMPHFDLVPDAETWKTQYEQYKDKNEDEEPPTKKIKTEKKIPYSVFLSESFKDDITNIMASLSEKSALGKFLKSVEFFSKDDPIFQPPKEEMASSTSSTGSLFELGSNALRTLPAPQAIEGLHAYGIMKAKLRDFFKGFVDQNKVVTEEEVREFFGNMKNGADGD